MTQQRLFTTTQLLEYLQIDRRHLYSLIQSETLKIGTHYLDIRKASSRRPVYRWKIAEVEKLFAVPPREREK